MAVLSGAATQPEEDQAFAELDSQPALAADPIATVTVSPSGGSSGGGGNVTVPVAGSLVVRGYTVSVVDKIGTYGAYVSAIKADALYAANVWVSLLPATAATSASIDIEVDIANTPSKTANGRAATTVPLFTRGDVTTQLLGTLSELQTGIDPNGAAADVLINIDPTYIDTWVLFDPTPVSLTVPSNKVDSIEVFEHEIGHGLGLNGFLDWSTGQATTAKSTFDLYVRMIGGVPYFIGPNAQSVYGGPVPLTIGNLYHVGNAAGSPGADLLGDLMNGVVGLLGRSPGPSALDVAFVKDALGATSQTAIETAGGTSLDHVGGLYFLDPSGATTGPSLKSGGVDFVDGRQGSWVPIAAEKTPTGYVVAWRNGTLDQYTVWDTDDSGAYLSSRLGTVAGTNTAFERLEPLFQQDLNGDGTIGAPILVIESNGLTKLLQVGTDYVLGSAAGPVVKYQGTAIVAGQFGGWTAIAAEATAGGFELALKMSGADQYAAWSLDSAGNFTAAALAISAGASPELVALETSFQQDLNGDGAIGLVATVIEAAGPTKLLQVGSSFALGSAGGPLIRYAGAAITAGQFGGWTPLGAEATTGGYEVMWKMAGADQYASWLLDAGGNFKSVGLGTATRVSPALAAIEVLFQQDFNGDGTIGAVATVIEAAGPTKLLQVGSSYALGSAAGPLIQYGGAAITVGQFGDWTPIGAEATAGGYEVVWKVAGADQYASWLLDAGGGFKSVGLGTSTRASPALAALEPLFQQDFNGDGTIGTVATVIEAAGPTKLLQVGPYYALGSAGGPLIQYAGAAITVGQFGGWTPLGAEATTGGYEVMWKMAGDDEYASWLLDAGGGFRSIGLGTSTRASPALAALEPLFQQDFNGDGTIGTVATVIEAAGPTRLLQVGPYYALGSAGGPLIQYAGAAITPGQFGGWTPIGAEATAGGYEVVWKMAGADQYASWLLDAGGGFKSIGLGVSARAAPALAALEPLFQQDFNGDGTIGVASRPSPSPDPSAAGLAQALAAGLPAPATDGAAVAVVAAPIAPDWLASPTA
ncbi:MAG: hypothetical protein U1E23_16490 [Reyranellaceae bacterium]